VALAATSTNDLALLSSSEIVAEARLRRVALLARGASRTLINQGKRLINRVYRCLFFENFVHTFELTNK
jgi:hypothetical protein